MRDPRAPAWSSSLVSRGTNPDPKSRSGVGFGVPEPPSFPGKWEKLPGSSIRIGIKSLHSPPGSSCTEIWEFGNCCHSRALFTFLVSSLALPKLPRQPHPRPDASQRSGSRSCRGSSWSLEKPSLDVGKPPGNGSQKVGKEGREGGEEEAQNPVGFGGAAIGIQGFLGAIPASGEGLEWDELTAQSIP